MGTTLISISLAATASAAIIAAVFTTSSAVSAQSTTAVQGSACQPYSYTGSLCQGFVDYQTSIPTANQPTFDGLLAGVLNQSAPIKMASATCYNATVALACSIGFPKCVNNLVQLPCYQSCQDVITTCTPALSSVGLLSNLTTSLNNCQKVSVLMPEAFPNSTCNAPSKIPAAGSVQQVTCPSFFLPNTQNFTTNNCAPNGCCVPCPVQDYFYPVGSFGKTLLFFEILQGASALLSAYVVFSWAVLPGRRNHPGDIVLHFSTAILIWQSNIFFVYGNPKRIQCYDNVTVSTASNNMLCGFQGAIVMCAVHAAVMWAGYMIFNLHATIVWRSSVFERFKPLGVVLCWGLPGIFTFIPFLLSAVDATTGVVCIISASKANQYFFAIQAVILIPSFILNTATMVHIMIVARKSSSMSNSGVSGGYSNNGSQQPAKPISARRQILQLLKLNWRALLLGLLFISTYVIYVIFFNLVVNAISTTSWETPWVQQWIQCVVTNTNTDLAAVQNDCAAKFASQLPPFSLIILSDFVAGSMGIWVFFIFGFNLQLVYDWGMFFSECCGGRRDDEENHWQ